MTSMRCHQSTKSGSGDAAAIALLSGLHQSAYGKILSSERTASLLLLKKRVSTSEHHDHFGISSPAVVYVLINFRKEKKYTTKVTGVQK